jgi:hypothetical protein
MKKNNRIYTNKDYVIRRGPENLETSWEVVRGYYAISFPTLAEAKAYIREVLKRKGRKTK